MARDTEQLEGAFKLIEQLETALAAAHERQAEPIAIVGLSCRLPRAESAQAFWTLLMSGKDGISEVPPERWDIDAYYDPDPDAEGKMSTRFGGFLDNIDQFDAALFNISPREAALMDPQQRLLLEACWEALEDAAISPRALHGSNGGVFVGICASDYARLAMQHGANVNAYLGTGNATSVAAGRIAYTFGLTGPAMSLDTACSSALVAIHAACLSLRSGECDLALAASVNLILAPETTAAFSKARMMAPDGRCKTFDERANGYVRSEGVGALVLKTLSKARSDGDTILAVIRGSAINQDGASGGLTVPNGPSQSRLIRAALRNAGVDAAAVGYLETHGTGTALGDPIEVGALAEVFAASHSRQRPLVIGSAKPVVGHLEVAAGIAGIAKVILALQNEVIPGHAHLQQLSSRIPWDRLPLAVPVQALPWPRSAVPRIAGLSAFGFSGTNAHLVIEEAPAAVEAGADGATSHLLCLSARSAPALKALAQRHADALAGADGVSLAALCLTANSGRMPFLHRLAVRSADPGDLRARLAGYAGPGPARAADVVSGVAPAVEKDLAFLFTGQGAHYAGMGQVLYRTHALFRAAIDRCAAIAAAELDLPLTQVLWGEHTGRLADTAYAQPALFALQYALAQLWTDWGIRPSFVAGHSVGEFAAACIAGVFTPEDGLRLICARARMMQALPANGAMAIVAAGRDVIESRIVFDGAQLSIAALNGPGQTVISGERAAVLDACEKLALHGVSNAGMLPVSHAFHSELMRPMLAAFAEVAATVSYQRPAIGFVSSVTGQRESERVATPEYWVGHVIAPVDFMAALRTLEARGVEAFLEIGPAAALTGLARACLPAENLLCVASLRRGADDWESMQRCLAALFVGGCTPDWRRAGRCSAAPLPKAALPAYPFERQRYWFAGTDALPLARAATAPASHPLLGAHLANALLPPTDWQHAQLLGPERPRFLADHRVYDKVIVPAAAYVEIAIAGLAARFPGQPLTLTNFSVGAALSLPASGPVLTQAVFSDLGQERYRFQIFGSAAGAEPAPNDDAGWQLHASGEVAPAPDAGRPHTGAIQALRDRFARGEQLEVDTFYSQYAAIGLQYGAGFQSVAQLYRLADESLAQISLPAALAADLERYTVHPAVLDGCFQAVGALFLGGQADTVYMPVGCHQFRLLRPLPARVWSHARIRAATNPAPTQIVADIDILDEAGTVLAQVDGLSAVRVERSMLAAVTASWKNRLYEIDWIERARSGQQQPRAGGSWLILADRQGDAAALAAHLRERGQECVLIDSGALDYLDKPAWIGLLGQHGAAPVAIVHMWALDARAADLPMAEQARLCGSTLALLQALMAMPDRRLPRLSLVTRFAHAVGEPGDPVNAALAPLWGLGRSIVHEHGALNCVCIDLGDAAAGVTALADELLDPDDEMQIALRGARRHVARLSPVRAPPPRDELPAPAGDYRLRALEYGSPDQLALLPMQRSAPASHEVEIEVRAAAINFKDVLYCLGMLKTFSEQAGIAQSADQPLGFECAGQVLRVGADVANVRVGDAVFAMAASAAASHVTIDHRLVHRKPDALSFEQAAALPTVFMTALHSLETLARIRPGDTVLIHACAGGVGQAAVQVALRAGATVFGTASPPKWPFLRQNGVAHVMNSRTLDFAEEVMALTGGRGVDIVLNCLAGDYIGKSAGVLAEGGRFVEIGKIGIWSAAKMAQFRPDIAYFSFDLGTSDAAGAPCLQAALLDRVAADFAAGLLRPLPVKSFPVRRAAGAFRYLAQAKNIGKVVLSMERAGAASGVRPDRSYLVTGGWGALGLHVARSLARNGARCIVLAGRSAPDAVAQQAIDSLAATGCQMHLQRIDVADPRQVALAFERIDRELPPLGGIVHAAGTLDDGVLVKQDWARFEAVMAPKVAGAWNLHQASRDSDIDFFVLFSSVAAVLGAPGQANYAAANAFLDSLARHRRGLGLPATSIGWGPWADAGMAEATRPANHARFASFGLRRLPADQSIEVFEHLLRTKPAAVSVLDVDWAKYLKAAGGTNARFYALVERGAAKAVARTAGAALGAMLEAPAERRAQMLLDYLGQEVGVVLGLAPDAGIGTEQPLLALGIDSLMAVEMKNRIERDLCCTLTPTLLLDYPTLALLAAHLGHTVLNLAAPVAADAPPIETLRPDAAAPLATMREHVIDHGGRSLSVCSWGPDGAPLALCVHGMLDQAASWDEVAAGLVQQGYRVMALDLRGHGRSDHHPQGANATAFDFMLDLSALADTVADPAFLLVGHSIGAAVCSLYAAAHPSRVGALALIEPVIPALREQQDPLAMMDSDLLYNRAAPAHPVYPDLHSAARMLTLNHTRLAPARAAVLAQRLLVACDGGWRWAWDARMRNPLGADLYLAREQFLVLAAGLRMPSLRLYGRASQFAASSVLLDPGLDIPQSRSVLIDGGHNLHTDNAVQVLDAIRALIMSTNDSLPMKEAVHVP